ncbi:ABC transporter permease [Sediminicoccus sp. KRV36]|uniref:ABC transporter permease n=1 Tax=Sediminicoccus sp. KRV36 TaxID=3133721 RepID=UPI00200F100D|nr:ABC transporter permease [Sediminicoccus rosea]UPY36772.1 ABC transporter permease [Sediminicoccus rosea]
MSSPLLSNAGQIAIETGESPGRRALRRFAQHKLAMFGLVIVVIFVAAAALAPWIAPFDPLETSWSRLRQPPSWTHPFGTDENGRDVLSRVLHGARASMMAGVIAVGGAVLIGVPIGLLAGLGGKWMDMVISRVADAMLSIPFLILAIALAAFLGPALENAMLAIAISASPIFVRLARGMALDARNTDWVEAARAMGNPPWRIGLVHVLPNILPPLLVQATLAIAEAIIAEASLSFLGLGQQPPNPSWGSMLNSAQRFIESAPWLAVFPGLAIFLVVLAFNLVGDGLRDALDPRSQKR